LTERPKLVVVGGGISGLAAGLRLSQLGHRNITIVEPRDRLGGVLQTDRMDTALVENSADMFTTKQPGATRLCRDLGFEESLIGTNDKYRRSFVVHRGKLLATPAGLVLMQPTRAWPIFTSPLMSIRGRLRMLGEYFVRKRSDGDTSLEEFALRRFGKEAYERLIQPMVGGIYTADPTKLSIEATMPDFLKMEKEHGSLMRAAFSRNKSKDSGDNAASGARYSAFLTPREGMSSLIDQLKKQLLSCGARLNLGSTVETAEKTEDGWRLVIDGSAAEFDGVVLASPSYAAAKILRDHSPKLADNLAGITYASTALAIFLIDRKKIGHALDGFGFVVPRVEQRRIIAGSFASIKFDGRAAADQVLIRVFVGGAVQPELLAHDDDEITTFAFEDLADLLQIQGKPIWSRLSRWERAMPQYHVGHVSRVATIDQQVTELPCLELAGNAYHGVGIPFCAASGYAAADRLHESLGATAPPGCTR
jgi:oxygen-dependent protoporphyrinogen oxidase